MCIRFACRAVLLWPRARWDCWRPCSSPGRSSSWVVFVRVRGRGPLLVVPVLPLWFGRGVRVRPGKFAASSFTLVWIGAERVPSRSTYLVVTRSAPSPSRRYRSVVGAAASCACFLRAAASIARRRWSLCEKLGPHARSFAACHWHMVVTSDWRVRQCFARILGSRSGTSSSKSFLI